MKFAFRLILTVLTTCSLFMQYGCASRGRPGGGPVDKIPPEIVYTFPQPDSLNIDDLEKIEFHFSERMDEASVVNSIFISPPLDYNLDWSGGEELILELNKELEKDRTYLITIGSGAMDARKNKMKKSFQLAFSTGNNLDEGQVSGQIYGINPEDNFYIYAYQMVNTDSLNPTVNQADFLSQPSDDGTFNMQYLPLNAYRIFVIEDQNKNLVLDANSERVGIPFRDIYLDSTNRQEFDLNFRTTKIDTVPPMLTGARAVYNNKVLIRFSEPVLTPNQIQIIDTLNQNVININALAANSENLSQIYAFTEQLVPERGYWVQTDSIEDYNHNVSTSLQRVEFSGSDKIDTTRFELLSITPKDSAINVKYPAQIEIKFSTPVDTLTLKNSFYCFNEQGDTLDGGWLFKDLSDCSFSPRNKFMPDGKYQFGVNLGSIKSLGDEALQDSLIHHDFFMISSDEFGSLSGITNLNSEMLEFGYLELFPASRNKESSIFRINADNTFITDWLLPGEYQIGGFVDLNNDNYYSHGKLFPFEYSEPVFIKSDTFKVRKRWEFGGLEIIYPKYNE